MSRFQPETYWSINGFSRAFAATCSTIPKDNKYHYVFQIPASIMRPTATHFKHFRTNAKGRAYQKCFHFFLDFMHEMISAQEKGKPQRKGNNTLAFLEWCPMTLDKTEIQIAGWRFHVFVDRDMNEMTVLMQMLAKFEKEIDKLTAKGTDVPTHYSIHTPVRYGTEVFHTYTGRCDNIEALMGGMNECSMSPSNAFALEEMPDSIFSLAVYDSDGEFTFPSNCFLRLDPEFINAENIKGKMLPCHMFFSCAKPEIRIQRVEHQYHVEFLAHRYFQEPDGFTGYWSSDQHDAFLEENKNKYIIFSQGKTRTVGDIGEVTYSEAQHEATVWLLDQAMDDMKGKASRLYEEMRTNQADISTIDMITLRGIDKPDKKVFIEEEFKTRVWHDEDAFISEPLKKVIRWFHKEYDPKTIRPYRFVHKDTSVMAHRACLLMYNYDKLYQVSSAHRAIYIVHLMRLDAFRHEMNMHLNCAFTGEAATSKSFVYEILKKNSIEGTVSERTYDTDKADAVDFDMNHFVNVFDEAPPGFFKDPKKRGPLEALKQKLTSMKTSHRRPFTDENGERHQINAISQNIGCLMGATNEPRSNFDKPLQTRFNWFEAEKLLNTTRSVAECQHAAETMGESQRDKLEEMVAFHKFEQAYTALVWQFVRMGRIKGPDTTAVGIVLRRFKQELETQGVTIHSRAAERVKRLSQNLAIVRAKQILYHTVSGKYANVPFAIEQVPDAEPFLICTEEIVIHAIGLVFDGIVSRNKYRVLKKLWQMHKESQNYRVNDMGVEDYNYIAMKGHTSAIASRVANALQEDAVHVSACNIVTIFRELRDHTICCRHYDNVDDGTINDGFPEAAGDAQGRFTPIEYEGGSAYFHMHLFKDIRRNVNEKNVYKSTVKSLMHEFTLPRRLLLGTNPFEQNEPSIWDTYDAKPVNREMMIVEGIGEQEDYYDSIGDTMDVCDKLEMDIDAYARLNRSKEVGYEVSAHASCAQDWGDYVAYPYRSNKRKR